MADLTLRQGRCTLRKMNSNVALDLARLGRDRIPAGSAAHVLDAVDMLRDLETGEKPLLGRKVAVYGGGNTAMDAARTAKRLGASEAIVVYRRTKDRMPAHESELAEAEDEGVLFTWLTTIKQVDAGKLVVERMELDESGFPQPTGDVDELDADSLVLALGQETDLSLLDGVPGLAVDDGVVAVGPDMMTGCAGSSPAATWCRTSARSPLRSATASGRPAISTRGSPALSRNP